MSGGFGPFQHIVKNGSCFSIVNLLTNMAYGVIHAPCICLCFGWDLDAMGFLSLPWVEGHGPASCSVKQLRPSARISPLPSSYPDEVWQFQLR